MGLLARADGDPEGAVQLLDQAEQLYRPGFFPDVRPIAAIKARIWIAQGNLAEAADWARERGVSATDDASYLQRVRPPHARTSAPRPAAERNQDSGALSTRRPVCLDRLYGGRRDRRDAPEASSRSACSRPWSTTRRDIGRGPWRPWPKPWRWPPNRRATSGSSWTRVRPCWSLLRDAERAWHRRRPPASPAQPRRIGRSARLRTRGRLAPSASSRLSERELQVLRLLDSELTGPQIARELFVSHNTVRTHTKHIFTKLDVTNRRAAVRPRPRTRPDLTLRARPGISPSQSHRWVTPAHPARP